jgi:hypothetical protein
MCTIRIIVQAPVIIVPSKEHTYSSCRMVSTYLVHHGYCATAESFAHGTGQVFDEEITSIKNRQSKWF